MSFRITSYNVCYTKLLRIFVDEAPVIAVTLDGSSNVTCNGGNDGAASITASGGTPGYSYTWTGQGSGFTSNNQDPINLVADTYDLQIEDSNSCIKIFSSIVTITEPQGITVTVNTVNNVSCNGGSDGSVLITPAGGAGGFIFAWTGNSTPYTSSDEDPTGMPADTYDLTITDANGCSEIFDDLLTVTEPPLITVTVDA